MIRVLALSLVVTSAAACAHGATVAARHSVVPAIPSTRASAGAPLPATDVSASPHGAIADCTAPCVASTLTAHERQILEHRIAALKEKGGPCSSYGAVIERSYRRGQITMRPYMWRVGAQLASGEARPDGVMILAREIDPLNVGRRGFDEVVWTIEHEAAHIAFDLDSPLDRGPGDRADSYVRACRS